MKRQFVESSGFRKRVDDEGDDGLLKKIQDEILKDPESGATIEGTGGVRKIRVAGEGKGKSGAYRVFYFDLPTEEITHLWILLLKGERENISAAEKKALKAKTEEIKRQARKGSKRR
jgi:hypothetical protein